MKYLAYIGAVALWSWIVYLYAYNSGVKHTQAKVTQAVVKQQNTDIKKTNDNINLVNNLNTKKESAVAKIIYKDRILVKRVPITKVCESGLISQDTVDLVNEALK